MYIRGGSPIDILTQLLYNVRQDQNCKNIYQNTNYHQLFFLIYNTIYQIVEGYTMDELNLSSLESMNEMQNMLGSGDSNTFVLSIVFGIIGMIYFAYGKKREGKESFFYSGIHLMAFPYFVSGEHQTISIGILLSVTPFLLRMA